MQEEATSQTGTPKPPEEIYTPRTEEVTQLEMSAVETSGRAPANMDMEWEDSNRAVKRKNRPQETLTSRERRRDDAASQVKTENQTGDARR